MFAKGPMPGNTPKADALALEELSGATCKRRNWDGFYGYVIELSDGTPFVAARSSCDAWDKARFTVLRQREKED